MFGFILSVAGIFFLINTLNSYKPLSYNRPSFWIKIIVEGISFSFGATMFIVGLIVI